MRIKATAADRTNHLMSKQKTHFVKMTLRLLLASVLLGYCLAVPTNKHASSKDRERQQPDLSSELNRPGGAITDL